MDKALKWILLAASMALVLWIRTLPLSLPVVEKWAEESVVRTIQEKIARDIDPAYTPQQWLDAVNAGTGQWIAQNREDFDLQVAARSRDLKSRLRFESAGGREYTYLGDVDSYLWLRNARSYLRNGTVCDDVVNGECRNTYNYAPVGSRMIYDRQLHTAAIVMLHRLATLFDPGVPLFTSAFLVPVLVGVLGVIPAFFIGHRLGGNLGGLFAALLISLQPNFLARSIGSDNDVWNVVLPLFIVWPAMTAMTATDNARRVLFGALAGVGCAMHAATWGGWFFTYGIILFCLAANVLIEATRTLVTDRGWRVWRAQRVRRAALVAGVFYATTWYLTDLADTVENYFTLPIDVFRGVAGTSSRATAQDIEWPNTLETVLELAKPGLDGVINSMGGILFLFGGLVGLVLLLLPRGRWRWWDLAILCFAVSIDMTILVTADLGSALTIVLLSAPLLLALLVSWRVGGASDATESSGAILVIVWFMGALYVAYGGVRYLELMAAPFGIAMAAGVGRLYQKLKISSSGAALWKRASAQAAYLGVAVLILSHPVELGVGTAAGYVPLMNDAWWETLEKIRRESQPDAIVNAWWDHGYWIAFVAERRVIHDGSSLLSHVPHWVGKALLAPKERQSIGLLRMLNCGSEATPLPEGKEGAFGKLIGAGQDPATAYGLVDELTRLDRAAAKTYLDQQGITGPRQDNILESTHCTPPDAYLITTSSALATTSAWMQLGAWDLRRAQIARTIPFWPRAQAVPYLVRRLGYSAEQAQHLYSEANRLSSEGRLVDFVTPPPSHLSPWYPCEVSAGTGVMVCRAEATGRETGAMPAFVYDPAAPENARMRSVDGSKDVIPAQLLVAGQKRIEAIDLPPPTHPRLGILLDTVRARLAIGSPELLRSTFVHLMLLDGRFADHYEKFSERVSHTGDRIVVWKINWPGETQDTEQEP